MEHEDNSDTNISGALGTIPKIFEKRQGEKDILGIIETVYTFSSSKWE